MATTLARYLPTYYFRLYLGNVCILLIIYNNCKLKIHFSDKYLVINRIDVQIVGGYSFFQYQST